MRTARKYTLEIWGSIGKFGKLRSPSGRRRPVHEFLLYFLFQFIAHDGGGETMAKAGSNIDQSNCNIYQMLE